MKIYPKIHQFKKNKSHKFSEKEIKGIYYKKLGNSWAQNGKRRSLSGALIVLLFLI